MEGGYFSISRLAYRPTGTWLVGSDTLGNLHVWNTESGKYERRIVAHKEPIHALQFSPDGKQLVTGGVDRLVKVWDGQSFTETARFVGHGTPVVSVAFRPDGRQLVSAERYGDLKFWDPTQNPTVSNLLRPRTALAGISFSVDAQRLAAITQSGDLEIWNVPQRRLQVRLPRIAKELVAVAWKPWEATCAVAAADGTIWLRDGDDGKVLRTFSGHKGPVRALAFSHDGTNLASGGDDGSIRLWDMQSGKLRFILSGHSQPLPGVNTVYGLAFHPDRKHLVSVGHDSKIRFWDFGKGVETGAHTVSGDFPGMCWPSSLRRFPCLWQFLGHRSALVPCEGEVPTPKHSVFMGAPATHRRCSIHAGRQPVAQCIGRRHDPFLEHHDVSGNAHSGQSVARHLHPGPQFGRPLPCRWKLQRGTADLGCVPTKPGGSSAKCEGAGGRVTPTLSRKRLRMTQGHRLVPRAR